MRVHIRFNEKEFARDAMSFFGSVVTGAKKVFGVVDKVEGFVSKDPLLSVAVQSLPFAPVVMKVIGRIRGAVEKIEVAHAVAGKEKSGAEKFGFVVGDFEAMLDMANLVANAKGKTITYDPEALANAVNSSVQAMNWGKKLAESIKEVDMAVVPQVSA